MNAARVAVDDQHITLMDRFGEILDRDDTGNLKGLRQDRSVGGYSSAGQRNSPEFIAFKHAQVRRGKVLGDQNGVIRDIVLLARHAG